MEHGSFLHALEHTLGRVHQSEETIASMPSPRRMLRRVHVVKLRFENGDEIPLSLSDADDGSVELRAGGQSWEP